VVLGHVTFTRPGQKLQTFLAIPPWNCFKVFAPSKKIASKLDCLDELVIVTWTCSLIPLPIVLLSLQMAFLLGLLFTNPCGHAQEQAYIAIFSR
jgi:hypothetical protein